MKQIFKNVNFLTLIFNLMMSSSLMAINNTQEHNFSKYKNYALNEKELTYFQTLPAKTVTYIPSLLSECIITAVEKCKNSEMFLTNEIYLNLKNNIKIALHSDLEILTDNILKNLELNCNEKSNEYYLLDAYKKILESGNALFTVSIKNSINRG